MTHLRRDFCAVLCSLLLTVIACASPSCRVDDYSNPAYRRDGVCTTHAYRGFCESSQRTISDAAADATSDAAAADISVDAADQPSAPSDRGAPCTRDRAEKLCYDGPDRTRATGACISGVAKCLDGRWTECFDQVLPAPESCNGADDDCDGRIDEDVHGDCVAESTGCAGRLTCRAGEMLCTAITEPIPETCNALDDDCDGKVDEDSDLPCADDNSGCSAPKDGTFVCTGACASGVRRCADGVLDKTCRGQVKPAESERCDEDEAGLDDDCDGKADEDCPCEGSGSRACYAANAQMRDTGACLPGKQRCVSGTWSTCTGAGKASAETCPDDGIDNDCNGRVDDTPGEGKRCVSSLPGQCHEGTRQCVDDELRCVTPDREDESCNAIDDDCDGHTDEDFDLLNDHDHCGACDTVCDEQEVCCNGTCADTRTNVDHCGMCNAPCINGLQCCDSFCGSPNDHDNCGACGHVCGAEETCCMGGCSDTQTDAQHCGGCNNACDHDCVAGECVAM